MAIRGLSKDEDIPRLFEYLIIYADEIEKFPGYFNFEDVEVDKFLNRHNIWYGSYNLQNIKKIKKNQWYILFEQRKNSKKSGSDLAHHFFRHLRNAIAHANIEKINRRINKINHQLFKIKDFNLKGSAQTMDCFIPSKLLYQLIDKLFATKKKVIL